MASRDIQYLKGIGEKRAKLMKKLGIDSVCALLRYYPRDYRNYTDIKEIYSAPIDIPCAVKGKIISNIKEMYIRKNMTIYQFTVTDGSALMEVKLYNTKFTAQKLKYGETYIFYGRIGGYGSQRLMSSPEIIDKNAGDITPIYSLTAGLYQSNFRNSLKAALEFKLPEIIPDGIRKKYRLCHIDYAISNIHFPEDMVSFQMAKRRLIFEELFLFRAGVALMKRKNKVSSGVKIESLCFEEFQKLLPFTLTDSQKKVIRECASDLSCGKQMNRLVEGDVGSGKTAVATALMYGCAKNKIQSVMMAPTEILAEQHYATVSSLLKDSGISVALLTGSVKKKQKEEIKTLLKKGEVDIIIGTQALIQGDVEFKNLGLVVTDEQHRFGVAQRAKLASKGTSPHILVMSATPIPRTLGLILYGDLDISIIDALPSGRKPIKTYAVKSSYRPRVYNFIRAHIDSGRQAYIVCPLVEENETNMVSAKEYYEKLSSGEFAGCKVGLLHGKMKPQEKEEVMRKFSEKEIDLLISTTVIEVGVDVPNSTIMVIENAERFGLSQLHQLRGRVGRGKYESTCVLISDAMNTEAKRRLKIMCETTNGFYIAEEDLKLRGPGDFLGHRQHGLPDFKIADLTSDMTELHNAGEAVEELLQSDPQLKNPENQILRGEIAKMFREKQYEMN